MKKTKQENIKIADIIGEVFGISFTNNEYKLGSWGDADNHCVLNENDLILLECEKGQKHPNTNVLKVYPYLEEYLDKRIVLIHYFFPENKAPKNRLALCNFIASKMESSFKNRFQYISLSCKQAELAEKLQKQNQGLIKELLIEKND